MTSNPRTSSLELIICALLFAVLFECFYYFDWEHGIARAVLLLFVALAACLLNYHFSNCPLKARSTWLERMCQLAAFSIIAFNMTIGVTTSIHSYRTGQIELDQGQNTYRAIAMLRLGKNPYGSNAMDDLEMYNLLFYRFPISSGCYRVTPESMTKRAEEYYANPYSPERERELFFDISDNPACSDLKRELHSTGYRYGPLLLFTYAPFFLCFGPAGLYIAHCVLFGIMAALLFSITNALTNNRRDSRFFFSLMVLTIVLPIHLRHNFLRLSASDLPPVVLGLASIRAWLSKRPNLVGILVGLSAGCKIMPGLLYSPLVIAQRKRIVPALLCLITATIGLIPFLAEDLVGTFHNYFYALTAQYNDSTALAFYVPDWFLSTIKAIAAIASLTWLFRLARKEAHATSAFALILFLHFAALLSGRYMHNNYLLWPLVMVPLYVFTPVFLKKE